VTGLDDDTAAGCPIERRGYVERAEVAETRATKAEQRVAELEASLADATALLAAFREGWSEIMDSATFILLHETIARCAKALPHSPAPVPQYDRQGEARDA
jgi:hypothetical protein